MDNKHALIMSDGRQKLSIIKACPIRCDVKINGPKGNEDAIAERIHAKVSVPVNGQHRAVVHHFPVDEFGRSLVRVACINQDHIRCCNRWRECNQGKHCEGHEYRKKSVHGSPKPSINMKEPMLGVAAFDFKHLHLLPLNLPFLLG